MSELRPSAESKIRDRLRALRGMIDVLVLGADEAPNRNSELLLRDAAARVADAMAAEVRSAMQ